MFDLAILDVVIGLSFVFLLVSTLCTAVREGIESFLKTRATYLEYGIRLLVHDERGDSTAKQLFNHPLIYGLYQGSYSPGAVSDRPRMRTPGQRLPSYISSRLFATALLDLVARGPSGTPSDASTETTLDLSLIHI